MEKLSKLKPKENKEIVFKEINADDTRRWTNEKLSENLINMYMEIFHK